MPASRLSALLIVLCLAPAGFAAVPQQMQAAAIDHPGAALTLHTLPVPKPAPTEVLIELHTAGVASWDVALRQHPQSLTHARMPLVLGTDGAGVIVAVGARVRDFKVGEPVYAYSWDNPQGGFYAEYVAVPAERVAHVPLGISLDEAGAIGTTALTAQQGVDDVLHLKSGETVFIHGAAGGVGTLAIQFAKLRGARVLASIGADDEADLVRSLGADAVVNGRSGDVAAAIHAFAPEGLDAVLALAPGQALLQAMEAMKRGGRFAYPTGVRPAPEPHAGVKPMRYDATPGPAQYARLNAAIEAAKFTVPIPERYPLEQAALAQKRVEAGHIAGKVMLKIR